jgi:crossover junction endodeoxyribonuclease RuvC
MSVAIGLDLSLTSTGVASSRGWVERIQVKGTGFKRLREIRDEVVTLTHSNADLYVVEALSIGSTFGQHLTRAGLWHMVMDRVDSWGTPWIEVAPTSLKKYATGKGNAAKDEVLAAAIRRFPAINVTGNDEADALWLAAIGADLLGEPMVEMPGTNRTVLRKLQLPEGIGAE